MTIVDLLRFLALGAILNWVSLAISLLALLVLLHTKVLNPFRATSYSAFLFCGLAVAHLQWLIYSGMYGDELGWRIWAATDAVAVASILGSLAAIKFFRQDKLIQVIVGMTLLLGVLQFSSMFGELHHHYLNIYARIYAFICIIAPVLATYYFQRSPK